MSLFRVQFHGVFLTRPRNLISLLSKLLNGTNPQTIVLVSPSRVLCVTANCTLACYFQSTATNALLHPFVHAVPSSETAFPSHSPNVIAVAILEDAV